MKPWALVAALAVNTYLLGAMALFAFVVYPNLGAAERSAFPAAYQAFNASIGLPVVTFEFLALLFTLALYAARPDAMPSWAVHVLTVLGAGYFAITFGWHLPSHLALAGGDNSATAMAPLLTSQLLRTVLQLGRAGFLAWCVVRFR